MTMQFKVKNIASGEIRAVLQGFIQAKQFADQLAAESDEEFEVVCVETLYRTRRQLEDGATNN